MIATMDSRVSRPRNTVGRMSIRRFVLHATSTAAGREPCVMHLADRRRYRHDQRQQVPRPLVEGDDVEEHQAPRQVDPAPEAAVDAPRRAATTVLRDGPGRKQPTWPSTGDPYRGSFASVSTPGCCGMPRLSSDLSAPTSTAEVTGRPGEPDHLAHGIDPGPRRPPGGHHHDGAGGPGREELRAERGVESHQGDQEVRGRAGAGHGLGEVRSAAPRPGRGRAARQGRYRQGRAPRGSAAHLARSPT